VVFFFFVVAELFEQKGGTEAHPLESILQMRKNPGIHFDLCHAGGQKIIPNQHRVWAPKAIADKFRLAAFMTVSDEAFLLLVLENNHARWVKQCPHRFEMKRIKKDWPSGPGREKQVKDFDKRHEIPPPLCTHKGRTERNKGWTEAGLKRCVALKKLVIADRKENGKAFDDCVCAHFKTVQQAPEPGKRNHDSENPEDKEVEMDCDCGERAAVQFQRLSMRIGYARDENDLQLRRKRQHQGVESERSVLHDCCFEVP